MYDLYRSLPYRSLTRNFTGKNTGVFWWEAGPEIQRYQNRSVSGDPDMDWIGHTLNAHFLGRLPMERCLSLGCGVGHLERKLASMNGFSACDAYDIAEESLAFARDLAAKHGYENIRYMSADINALMLPEGQYDAVWSNNALHHLTALENICRQVRRTLKPEGLFVLKEYVGPNRFQFPERQKEIIENCLLLIPEKFRKPIRRSGGAASEGSASRKPVRWYISRFADKLADGDLIGLVRRRLLGYARRNSSQSHYKMKVNFPSVRDVIATDPSEAVRSEDICGVIEQEFQIVDRKALGGNILQFLLFGIAGNFSTEDPTSQSILKMLIDIENTLLESGEFQSDFIYLVARPKAALHQQRFTR